KDYTGMNFTFTGSPAISGLSCGAISTTADGRAKCDVTFSSASVYSGVITVTANDAAGDKFTSQTFNLNVYNNAPVVQPLKCDQATRVGQVYMPKTASKNYDGCQLAAIDPDGDKISSYNASVYPPGFAKLTGAGIFAGTPTTAGIYDIDFTAADQYGANSKPLPFQLHVNTYCGDGIKQDNPPNGESNGGPGNDGYEQCDCGNLTNQQCVDAGCTDPSTGKVDYSNCNQTNSTTGVPPAGQSSISWQYGCSKTCVNSNGGYCGDGIIQDGLYSKFASAAGQQTLPNNLLIKHGKTNFGEQCDFGGDINCCDKSTCQWTTGPTDEVSIAGDAYLAKGETMNLDIPACRGVSGGTFTATLRPYGQGYGPDTGPAIVFVTDLSGSMFDPTYSITAQVMENIVDSLFNQAITKQVNIHVGAIATYGVYDQSTGFFVGAVGKEVNIGNLKGSGGISQRDALLSSITSYSKIADPPDFSSAFDTARTMLTSYANAAPNEKYIIFLTDGYPAGAKAEADAARNAGIKVYVAAFNNWDQRFNDGTLDLTTCSSYLCQSLRSMCSWSNDNGNLNVCYKNINLDNSNNSAFTGYTYYVGNKSGVEPINPPNPDLVGSRLAIIYNNIVADILSRMPTNITYTVVGGATNDLSNFASANFALPASVTVCDPSGATSCNPNSFVIKADFNGTGQVEFNNFKLNVVPLCKVE
ncbi:MAG TPA: vWA domain-containing protein, partial [Candidatus Methylomirabilis sp.]|nr:vWA domain-containing protein [Candidatus Methylomirabilis sp.]